MKGFSRSNPAQVRPEPQHRARSIIDDLYTEMIAERREEIIRCEAALANARRELAEVQGRRLAWRRHGQFDHVLGVRALLMAQIADLDRYTDPPGANLAAMMQFLGEHHPPVTTS